LFFGSLHASLEPSKSKFFCKFFPLVFVGLFLINWLAFDLQKYEMHYDLYDHEEKRNIKTDYLNYLNFQIQKYTDESFQRNIQENTFSLELVITELTDHAISLFLQFQE
jgi:hypothetical protein